MADLQAGRTIFANVRWMEFYAGSEKNLPPTTFGFLKRTGLEGAETLNMRAFEGRCYGYVPFKKGLRLTRIDPEVNGDVVEGVTVVMTATRPGGGSYVVGWYENASVHTKGFLRPNGGKTHCKISAAAGDTYLVPTDRRDIVVDRGGADRPGTSPITYISEINPPIEARVLAEINAMKRGGMRPVTETLPTEGLVERMIQTDPELRSKVERAAVARVCAWYQRPAENGSAAVPDPCRSVERDNIGWDVETGSGLRIEVKGRLARSFVAELTPNEYKAFVLAEADPALAATYRLAIVAAALDEEPDMAIFAYAEGSWRCVISGRVLGYQERPGARVGMLKAQPGPETEKAGAAKPLPRARKTRRKPR